jgi:hypothetical protein
MEDRTRQFEVSVPAEWQRPGQAFVQQDPKCPDVASSVGVLPAEQLRRHVRNGTGYRLDSSRTGPGQGLHRGSVEAACNPDPVLRLTGVNRALEGLAIDVFNTMREFGDVAGDPVLEFCEDWMLADEVTHVKMGSDWLRRITANDPDRQKNALEFQRAVDKLFSFGGFRGEQEENPVHLARNFRALAGFSDEEIEDLVEASAEAYAEAQAMQQAAAGQ